MKLNMRDLVSLQDFKNGNMLTGEAGMERTFTGITVLDFSSNETNVSNDLVLVSRDFHKNDTQTCIKILNSIQKHCALILIMKDNESLDRRVIDEAIASNFPIFVLNYSFTYFSIIDTVMAKLIYRDQFSNTLISNTIFHLLNFEKYSNFQEAIKAAAIKNDFQFILLSFDFNPIFSVETRHTTTIAEAIKLGRLRALDDQEEPFIRIDVNGVLTYWGSVILNDERLYMFIVDNEDSYSQTEITKLAEIIKLSMAMWQYCPDHDLNSEFIKALKRGNIQLAHGVNKDMALDQDDIVSVFAIENMEMADFQNISDKLEDALNSQLLYIKIDDKIYGLISIPSSKREEVTDYKSNIVAFFDEVKRIDGCRITHVTGVKGILGAVDGYGLISEGASIAKSIFPHKRVFTKYELTLVSNCIDIYNRGGMVKKSYMELLDGFDLLGKHKAKQLLETLSTFVLDAGMNSANTSKFMDIHNNTVQYRLKKINEILGVEITGNRVIPGLTMSLALKRISEASNEL